MTKWLPRALPGPGLREVQQALAREQGFDSWAELKQHVELAQLSSRPSADLVSEFLQRGCLSYGSDDFPSKWQRAKRIVERFPEVATSNLYAAIVAGELEQVRGLLADDPTRVSAKGGPQGWEPLLFLCYGRVPTAKAAEGSLAIARLLLEAGADANACFVFHGNQDYRFTALTGAMGEGELGQPRHPQAEALVRLLLEHGANPNDSQGLYNTHLVGDDTHWLELLSSFGLSKADPVNWQPQESAKIFDYLLAQAADAGQEARLRWLLEHGANPDARSTYTGKSCHEMALLGGHERVAELLLEFGAPAAPLTGVDAFVAAARQRDRSAALTLLEGHPEYLADVEPLLAASSAGDAACVRLLLELGMNPNGQGKHGHRALNNGCNHRAVVEALWEHGADPSARCYGGTPAAWSLHGGSLEMARLHAERGRSIFDAVASGHLDLVRELLNENPTCVAQRTPSGNTPLHELPEDPDIADPILRLLVARGADPAAKNAAGETAAEFLDQRGRDVVADLLSVAE